LDRAENKNYKFDSDSDREQFTNQLINKHTIEKWI